ncbi:MAG: chemotaxis protein CheX [Candidatus Hydrogenedens sp.]
MNEMDKELIKKVLTDVAKEFAFMFADDWSEQQDAMPPYIKAEMSFSGPYKGNAIIVTPEELCREMMSNVLGIDEEETDIEVEPKDALCEFLNIFCGNFLTSLAGTEPVFELQPPSAEEINEEQWEKIRQDADFVELSLDDYPVYISVECKNE